MNPVHTVRRRRVSVAALLTAGALFAAPAARAGLPLPHELHREIRSHLHDVLRTLIRIPAEIHRDHLRDLEYFLGGNVYFAAHRHYHPTYNFPVWIDGGVSYQPYTYCNGRLYGSYAARPQLWLGWGVEAQGRWCPSHRSYYPVSHSCFRQTSHAHGPHCRSGADPHYRSGEWFHGGSSQSGQAYGFQGGSENRPQYKRQSAPAYRSQLGSRHGSQHRSRSDAKQGSTDHQRRDHGGKRTDLHRGANHQ